MTITEFLLARIAEDEEEARALSSPPSVSSLPPGSCWECGTQIPLECEAKRRIVAHMDEVRVYGAPAVALDILRALALPYADHPDYSRAEWRFDT